MPKIAISDDQAAIIGIGEHPTGMFPDKSPLELVMSAIKEAIRDAGVSKDRIRVIITQAILADPWFNADLTWSRLVEELGLSEKCRSNFLLNSGGSTASNIMMVAQGLFKSGEADLILVAHVEKLGTGVPPEQVQTTFSTVGLYEEWEAPYGSNYNAICGMITHRYLHETGASIEEVASVVSALRTWGSLNPNALLRRRVTVEEVLAAKMVASPQTSRMCNIACDGASAFLLAPAKRARELVPNPVYLLSTGSLVTHYSLAGCSDLTRMGWAEAGREAFERAGLTPADIDVAEIYDSYPVIPLLALEGLGFCEYGKAGRFVMEGHTLPGGRLPMTTTGGMISVGHIGAGGGTALLVEGARQLMGKAGERQVNGARTTVVTEVGGQYMDAHVMILGRES